MIQLGGARGRVGDAVRTCIQCFRFPDLSTLSTPQVMPPKLKDKI